MDISMDIHRKPVDMDMDMDGKFHIHGKPGNFCQCYADLCCLRAVIRVIMSVQPVHLMNVKQQQLAAGSQTPAIIYTYHKH